MERQLSPLEGTGGTPKRYRKSGTTDLVNLGWKIEDTQVIDLEWELGEVLIEVNFFARGEQSRHLKLNDATIKTAIENYVKSLPEFSGSTTR